MARQQIAPHAFGDAAHSTAPGTPGQVSQGRLQIQAALYVE